MRIAAGIAPHCEKKATKYTNSTVFEMKKRQPVSTGCALPGAGETTEEKL
jgi:hypothetical protein